MSTWQLGQLRPDARRVRCHVGMSHRVRLLAKQSQVSAICELDLAGLEDFITVLSATTDNVALLDDVRERHGNDPFQWLPVLLREVQDRRFRTSRRTA